MSRRAAGQAESTSQRAAAERVCDALCSSPRSDAVGVGAINEPLARRFVDVGVAENGPLGRVALALGDVGCRKVGRAEETDLFFADDDTRAAQVNLSEGAFDRIRGAGVDGHPVDGLARGGVEALALGQIVAFGFVVAGVDLQLGERTLRCAGLSAPCGRRRAGRLIASCWRLRTNLRGRVRRRYGWPAGSRKQGEREESGPVHCSRLASSTKSSGLPGMNCGKRPSRTMEEGSCQVCPLSVESRNVSPE